MTTNTSAWWAPRRPPTRVLEDARSAFDERNFAVPGCGRRARIELVFDSLADDVWTPTATTRVLMFSGDDLAILLTSTRCAEGHRLAGAVFTRTPVTVTVRRPRRPTTTIAITVDGRLLPTTIESGPACVFARDAAAARSWHSDWLTL
jgi:hypothetical protein